MTELKVGLNFKQTTTKTATAITQNFNIHIWDCPQEQTTSLFWWEFLFLWLANVTHVTFWFL